MASYLHHTVSLHLDLQGQNSPPVSYLDFSVKQIKDFSSLIDCSVCKTSQTTQLVDFSHSLGERLWASISALSKQK